MFGGKQMLSVCEPLNQSNRVRTKKCKGNDIISLFLNFIQVIYDDEGTKLFKASLIFYKFLWKYFIWRYFKLNKACIFQFGKIFEEKVFKVLFINNLSFTYL